MSKPLSDRELSLRFLAMSGMAQELGELASRYFADQGSLNTQMKGAQDFVTEADHAVEVLFRKQIAAAFPDDSVMGEEMGGGGTDRLWIIDPIDGTANFARGDRQWCISIGFVAAGRPELGIIHAPSIGETYLGRRGQGATLNGKPIRAAETRDIRRSVVEFGWSTRMPTRLYIEAVERLYELGAHVKRSGSGALGLAQVAAGRTDGYAELHINSWDAAAALLIAEEAGARINEFFSGDWLEKGNPILATAPNLWEVIREASGIANAPPSAN